MNSSRSPVERALALLAAIVADAGRRSLSEVAAEIDLPRASAHRATQAMVRAGYLLRSRRGYYHAGPALVALAPELDSAMVAAGIARPMLAQLANRYRCLAHLGIFEQDMVTYLVKEGAEKDALFTREDMQLEAYCSGLGKVLLAALDEETLEAYLSNGPFVGLTPKTIVESGALYEEIARVRQCRFAVDAGETDEDLYCLAVPLTDPGGRVFAAISLSFQNESVDERQRDRFLSKLRTTAGSIERRLHGSPDWTFPKKP